MWFMAVICLIGMKEIFLLNKLEFLFMSSRLSVKLFSSQSTIGVLVSVLWSISCWSNRGSALAASRPPPSSCPGLLTTSLGTYNFNFPSITVDAMYIACVWAVKCDCDTLVTGGIILYLCIFFNFKIKRIRQNYNRAYSP